MEVLKIYFSQVVCLFLMDILLVTEDMRMRSTVVSSCWEASVKGDMDLVHSEVSTSQEMGYVCRQFSSELKRKFEVGEDQSIIQ